MSHNLSDTLSEDSEQWLLQVRAEETQRFATQLARVTAIFNFAILATSFMYGLGVFRVSNLAGNISPAIWIVGLSIGAVAMLVGFAMVSAREYAWFDISRIRLHLILDFYDTQKALGATVKLWIPTEQIPREYWRTDFLKELKETKRLDKDNKDKMFIQLQVNEDRTCSFTHLNWLECLRQLRTYEKPLMPIFWTSLLRQYSIRASRSPYGLMIIILVILSLIVSFAVGLLSTCSLIIGAICLAAVSLFAELFVSRNKSVTRER